MLSAPHRSSLYYRLANCYDAVFAPFFQARAEATIRSLNIPAGAKVLEIGVGTGLSLAAYPPHADVTGVDLSPHMLERARDKVQRHTWRHIDLLEMDACHLEFAADSFDYVMAFHIVSVVPDLGRLMREIARVCRPGGQIAIINHLRSERPWIAAAVDALEPLTHRLGWHTRLGFDELCAAAPLTVLRRYKTSPRSLFTIVIAEKPRPEAAEANSLPARG